MAKARFDGYLASRDELQIGQVIFAFGHRAVVRERFVDMEAWNAERTDRNRPGKEETPGFINKRGTGLVPQSEPPQGFFYYGANWLPEERQF